MSAVVEVNVRPSPRPSASMKKLKIGAFVGLVAAVVIGAPISLSVVSMTCAVSPPSEVAPQRLYE